MMKLVIKICLFSLPLIILIGVLNFYLFKNENTNFNKGSTFFIGSSRVQRSINPDLLKKDSRNNNIYNVGISGATFLHNIIMAEHLIETFDAKKICIELSPIIYTLHKKLVLLDIYNTSIIHKSIPLKEYIDYTEATIFHKLSLKNVLKKILTPNNKFSEIGYTSSDENHYSNTDSFLRIEDIERKYNYAIDEYIFLISQLTQLAEHHNTELVFFMPVTFHKNKEKEIVTSVFQWLPKKSKVVYTEDFLTMIRNPDYLFNKNHLNSKGAKIMTDYIKKQLSL